MILYYAKLLSAITNDRVVRTPSGNELGDLLGSAQMRPALSCPVLAC